ncbi:phage terminase small subunit [Bradyrhizobium sp. GM24.11]
MTTRGRKPKPTHLRLVEGTHRADRHGGPETLHEAAASAGAFGPLKRPTYLKRFAKEAWSRYIAPASWLDASREPCAVAFCELWAEMRSAPSRFQAARHAQLRAYMSELGLTDERRRAVEQPADRDEFFDE